MIKQPMAIVPIVMSLAAVVTVLVVLARFGVVREADEGAAAHIWQLLLLGQVPIIAAFAIASLPKAPKQALAVLALQAVAAIAALAPVFMLGL